MQGPCACAAPRPSRRDELGKTTARQKDIEEMAHELVDLYANRELVHRTSYGKDSMLYHEFERPSNMRKPRISGRPSKISRKIWPPPNRWTASSAGMWAMAKRKWRCGPPSRPSKKTGRWPSWSRPRSLPINITTISPSGSRPSHPRGAVVPLSIAQRHKAIIKDTAAGLVDVLIGTHRLLQKDVQFRNLGLVIIDEEQWFGVKHKERRNSCVPRSTLTLTATPIPRTLQMTMASVRDLSIIDTPRPGALRFAPVLRFSEKRSVAILRELGRADKPTSSTIA